MSSSIRHKLRRNSRDSYEEEGGADYDDADNHPSPKNHPPRAILGGYGNNMLQKKKDDQQQQQQQQQSKLRRTKKLKYSNSMVLEDLSNPKSELARFLLLDGTDQSSMGHQHVWFYEMALQPLEERRERIIMIAEAQAIFGALFLTGSFVVYEWGSSLAYGGSKNDVVDRIFECVMAIGITANLLLALVASFLWQFSVVHSAYHQSWVYGCRKFLHFQHHLQMLIMTCTIVGMGLGIYNKFSYYDYWIELAVCLFVLVLMTGTGLYLMSDLVASELPLEYYHLPLWFKYSLIPFKSLTSKQRKEVRDAAMIRAKELKERAYRERLLVKPKERSSDARNDDTPIGKILRDTAIELGRCNFDVSIYEQRLEADWFDDINDLKAMSADELSKYMPRKLAIAVSSKLHDEK